MKYFKSFLITLLYFGLFSGLVFLISFFPNVLFFILGISVFCVVWFGIYQEFFNDK
jgi:hypothetical protein